MQKKKQKENQIKKAPDRRCNARSRWCRRVMLAMLVTLLSWVGAGKEVYAGTAVHHHSGDDQNGGGCYQQPVYHTHSGSPEEGGECYQAPVYHVHTGDAANGGGCYGEEVHHTHQGSSQTGGACYTAVYHSHTEGCYREGSHREDCAKHWDRHSYDCGTMHDWDGDGHGCDGFYIYDCGGHQELACDRGNQIVAYSFSCTISEDTCIGYALNCNKTEEDVDVYELTCEKTDEEIDYYELTCGMEEGEEYEVPDPEPEPDQGADESDNSGGDWQENTEQETTDTQPPMPDPVTVPEPEVITEAEPVVTPEPVSTPEPISTLEPIKAVAKPSAKKPPITPSPVVTPTPSAMKRVISEVKPSPVKAQPVETSPEPVVIRKTNLLLTPAGKIISITLGTLVLVLLAGWLLLYLRRSVRVYNDNGKGRMHYLGRARVEQTEEGYCIHLADRLVERAVTNRYSIRPDLFLLGKDSNWEVFIVKDGKKKAVYLEKEIRITI